MDEGAADRLHADAGGNGRPGRVAAAAGGREPAWRASARDDGLELRFDAAAEDEVGSWIRAEEECCAFLSFDLDRAGDELRLAVTGPPGAEPVLDGLLAALTGTTAHCTS